MKKSFFRLLSLCLTLALVFTGCSGSSSSGATPATSGTDSAPATSGASVTIRYGAADPEDMSFVKGILAFKEYVESASNGTIQVETYTNGVLGGDRELCEAMQIGTCDMAVVMGGILANYDTRFNIFQIPYLFETKQASYDAMDGEFGSTMAALVEENNFKCLGWADGNTYHIANSGEPVTTLDGLKGMKLRVPEIQLDIDFFTALGATPTPISFSETYTALEQKVVTGLEMPAEQMYWSKFMETVDSITLTGHIQGVFPILMSNSCWNSLSEEQQKIVMEGVAEQVRVNRELAQSGEESYLESFQKDGGQVVELTAEEKEKFIAVGDEIASQYSAEIGQDLIDLAKSYNN